MPLATPEELEKNPPPPLPFWIRKPYPGYTSPPLLPSPEFQFGYLEPKKKGAAAKPYAYSNPGPQTWMQVCPYDEILCGGRRGGSKSWGLVAWMTSGDPFLPADDPAHYSFLLDPHYRGLILRREYQSMAELVDAATEFYAPLGGKPKDDPVVFTFPSGAKIYTNHLGDQKAFEKYRGMGLTRIAIEELTQIEEERWYLKLLGSMRSKPRIVNGKTYPPLRTQILSTTNPDGSGQAWVKKRFVKVLDSKGKKIKWNTPMRDPRTGLWRIFIPMALKDNPYLRDNKTYEGMLLAQDEVTRKQWMDGDWDAASGTFFTEWRPDGPVTDEEREKYPWAKHVIESADLKPWWYRFGGGDWGYDHPAIFHKLCRSERDGRLHCYDELSLRGCGSYEMGVALGNWWLPDLEYLPDKTVTIAFSPDAFSKTDANKTKAEQIADGIKSVLGPYGAFMLKYSDDERRAMERDPALAQRMFDRRRAENSKGQYCIVLKSANTDRVAGWSYMREMLRFRNVVQETETELKARLTDLFSKAGVEAYERELARVKKPIDQYLPKLQVWRRCAVLRRFMEEAIKDENNTEDIKKFNAVDGVGGDDGGDCLRMALMSFRDVETTMPKAYFLSEKMEQIQTTYEEETGARLEDINRLIMVQQRQSAKYDQGNASQSGAFSLPRASSSRHRKVN